ncbi:hypothetical protein AYI68_g2685 [Smittium mucronatum]|uniref:Uncharacterized protein n=1 Tax=Smittium mucronatum TaxID=133383 RepID=A0A1R0H238_9FUNG|nr:hypothetical protein AYI68_g2685 [Smittium mucronatum]
MFLPGKAPQISRDQIYEAPVTSTTTRNNHLQNQSIFRERRQIRGGGLSGTPKSALNNRKQEFRNPFPHQGMHGIIGSPNKKLAKDRCRVQRASVNNVP